MQKYTIVWEEKNIYVPLYLVTISSDPIIMLTVKRKNRAIKTGWRTVYKGVFGQRRKKCKKKRNWRKRKTIFQSQNRLTSDVLEWQKVWKNTKIIIIIITKRANWIFDVYNYVRQPHGLTSPTRTINGHLISYSFDIFV